MSEPGPLEKLVQSRLVKDKEAVAPPIISDPNQNIEKVEVIRLLLNQPGIG